VRILLAIPSLRCGGSERVMSILANHWAAAGHQVAVATFEPPDRDFFVLDATVARFVIGTTGPAGLDWMRTNTGRLREFRSAIAGWKPDVILSFIYTVNLLAIAAGRGLAPVVVAERTDPRFMPIERWQSALRRLSYPRAAAVTVQTDAVLQGWARGIARGALTRAIPNPVLPPRPTSWTGDPAQGPVIAAAGRLEHGKGFDVLLRAFAKVAADHCDWSLVIMGEGEERAALTAQATRYSLSDRVLLPGIGNTAALFARADVFASASRLEGFPNTLLEAIRPRGDRPGRRRRLPGGGGRCRRIRARAGPTDGRRSSQTALRPICHGGTWSLQSRSGGGGVGGAVQPGRRLNGLAWHPWMTY
jgi:glycosyltransferase involved in cell wall biosynthesis